MSLNVVNCKVLHIGSNNNHNDYSLNDSELVKVTDEKHFKITSDMKSNKHFSEVVKMADNSVGFIGRTFEFKSKSGNSHIA